MPIKKPVRDTLYVRGCAPFAEQLNEIASEHKIPPTEFARGLLDAACQFYRKYGWFSFPVVILPEKFHQAVRPDEVPPHLMDKFVTGFLTKEEVEEIKSQRGPKTKAARTFPEAGDDKTFTLNEPKTDDAATQSARAALHKRARGGRAKGGETGGAGRHS